ncbi:MAG TPA: GGDEF domain-containing protein, partial [Pseudomonas sp.]|nr:GGDEF domain-containing protein [Pseudomonas sp.]
MSEPLDRSDRYRRRVLKALLWTTLGCGIFFATVNILRDIWLLAVLELGYAAFSAFLLRIVDRTPHLRTWTQVYLGPFFLIMMVALVLPNATFAVFAWIQTIPIICYLLLGLRQGFWTALLFISLGLLAFNHGHHSGDTLMDLEVTANIGLASLAIMLFSHIYERSRLHNEQRLLELASTDSLTGLANRTRLAEIFQRESAHARRTGAPLSLVFLDIDHFKQINDRHGHSVGDRMLRAVAARLSDALRDGEFIARFGAD